MGFSRGLANITTFGAVGRVDKAKESYSALYREYRSIISRLEKIREYSRRVVEADKAWSHFIKHNDVLDKGISEETRQALELLETDLDPSVLAENFLHLDLGNDPTIREDSIENNLATFGATSIMNTIIPGLGVLGFHLMANEEIEEIKKESNKIMREIDRIMPTFKQAAAQCNKLRLRNEAFRHIKEVLEKNGFPCSSLPYVEDQPPEVKGAVFGKYTQKQKQEALAVAIKEKLSNGNYGIINCLYDEQQ